MALHPETVATYDESAEALAEYFKGIGPRVEHINRALELVEMTDGTARVVEVGCGDGRDAVEIVTRVASYIGFDPSKGMLRLARNRLPDTTFVKADSLSFEYPTGLDVIFAFASLIHSDVDTNRAVFNIFSRALRIGGIAMVNVRERDEYEVVEQTDQFGTRVYHYYNSKILRDIAGSAFVPVFEDHKQIGSNTWLTMAFQKLN
jgi:SAM-dependent methyltransferase